MRNFKPSKTKKVLPDLHKNLEQKLSQLADSNVTPLGLFNQDLHAQREWNQLMQQKNFSATMNNKQIHIKDNVVQDIMMPMPTTAEANKTSDALLLMPLNSTIKSNVSGTANSQEVQSEPFDVKSAGMNTVPNNN